MLAFDVALSFWWLVLLILSSATLGFFVRSRNISSLKKKVSGLENEMLRSHAEILELQKQNSDLERKFNESQSPVIPMKGQKEDKAGSQKRSGN